MAVPIKYRGGGEASIASYDYTDIAEGTGIVTFQGYNTFMSGAAAASYHLTTSDITSYDIMTGFKDPATDGSIYWNFDTSPFNLPKLIEGTATIRFLADLRAEQAATKLNFKLTLQKFSEGAVTNIGDTITTASLFYQQSDYLKNLVVKMDVPKTHFKKGDILRLHIVPNMYESTGTIYLFHDPMNRSTTISGSYIVSGVAIDSSYPTKLETYIPFKLDL